MKLVVAAAEVGTSDEDTRAQGLETELLGADERTASAAEAAGGAPSLPGGWGDYVLLRELGQGAMATVYEALDADGGRVALKLPLRPRSAHAIAREARALAFLVGCPGLPRLLHAGRAQGRAFLALELLEGVPLSQHLRARGPLSVAEAARAFAPVARTLAAMHELQVVHRDVKPANVLVSEAGAGRLIDFGLALLPAATEPRGCSVGTPAYMALEQLRCQRAEPAADVFGLGATIHEALTGALPHPADDVHTLARLRRSGPPLPLRERWPEVPSDLDRLLTRCLSARAAERPPASELAGCLGLLEHLPRELLDGGPGARPAGERRGRTCAA